MSGSNIESNDDFVYLLKFMSNEPPTILVHLGVYSSPSAARYARKRLEMGKIQCRHVASARPGKFMVLKAPKTAFGTVRSFKN